MPCKSLTKALAEKNVPYRYIELDENYTGEISSVPTTVIEEDGKEVQRIVGNQASKIAEAVQDGC
jgi:hypothetical protein